MRHSFVPHLRICQFRLPLLFARVVGGESFGVIDQSGTWRQATFVPWHFEALAGGLAYLTIGVVFLAAIWAVWRSGAAQPYSLALCFSLGTLLPGEVFTYQFLPMLPLLVIVFMKALERREVGRAQVGDPESNFSDCRQEQGCRHANEGELQPGGVDREDARREPAEAGVFAAADAVFHAGVGAVTGFQVLDRATPARRDPSR